MKALADGIEYAELRAEFRAIIRHAWKAQGITAKGDRAESDAFECTQCETAARLGIAHICDWWYRERAKAAILHAFGPLTAAAIDREYSS